MIYLERSDLCIEQRKKDRARQYCRKHAGDFILLDTHGQLVRLESLLERGPAVIRFYRGGRCPYCNLELVEFQRVLPAIESLGASLLAIGPELPRIAQATEQRNKLTFPVLSDIKNVVARRLGIVVKPTAELLALYEKSHHLLGEAADFKRAMEFPIPSAFGVDPARTIRMAYLEQDGDKHMAPAMALRALKRLHG